MPLRDAPKREPGVSILEAGAEAALDCRETGATPSPWTLMRTTKCTGPSASMEADVVVTDARAPFCAVPSVVRNIQLGTVTSAPER